MEDINVNQSVILQQMLDCIGSTIDSFDHYPAKDVGMLHLLYPLNHHKPEINCWRLVKHLHGESSVSLELDSALDSLCSLLINVKL